MTIHIWFDPKLVCVQQHQSQHKPVMNQCLICSLSFYLIQQLCLVILLQSKMRYHKLHHNHLCYMCDVCLKLRTDMHQTATFTLMCKMCNTAQPQTALLAAILNLTLPVVLFFVFFFSPITLWVHQYVVCCVCVCVATIHQQHA